MNSTKYIVSIVSIFFCLLTACVSLSLTPKKPHVECCSFDLETLTLSVSCVNEEIKHVDAFTIMSNSEDPKLFGYRKTFDAPTRKTIIPIPIDSIVRQKEILIKLWVNEYVIDDYRIKIGPDDWGKKKILYGVFSAR